MSHKYLQKLHILPFYGPGLLTPGFVLQCRAVAAAAAVPAWHRWLGTALHAQARGQARGQAAWYAVNPYSQATWVGLPAGPAQPYAITFLLTVNAEVPDLFVS